jgi:hypothetical protein
MDQSLENRIRERAYEIWVAHDCVHGQADQHWLTAEGEILAASTAALAREPAPQKKRRSPARSKITKTLARAS